MTMPSVTSGPMISTTALVMGAPAFPAPTTRTRRNRRRSRLTDPTLRAEPLQLSCLLTASAGSTACRAASRMRATWPPQGAEAREWAFQRVRSMVNSIRQRYSVLRGARFPQAGGVSDGGADMRPQQCDQCGQINPDEQQDDRCQRTVKDLQPHQAAV